MTNNYKDYRHWPLSNGQIRLLRACSDYEASQTLHRLDHVNVEDSPDSIALSYPWMGAKRSEDLLRDNSIRKVTWTVFAAIPYVFKHIDGRPF